MKLTTSKSVAALVLSLLVAVVVGSPAFVLAYTLIGGSLGVGTGGFGYQRDFHVWNNSADVASNNNQIPDPNYPGALGAVLASWKGARGWASDNSLAARNFDYDFQGTQTSNNDTNGNAIGWASTGCSGGVLAYTETPIDDGWRIIMCDSWNWDDGPSGIVSGAIDIQGVVTHEIGHALGMGHSATGCGAGTQPTMCPAIFGDGTSQRTIEADDQAGLQAIYGTIPPNKPVITSLTGSQATGGTLVIHGSNFAATVNVKFTAQASQNTGTITGVVYGVPSSSGGTIVNVVIPVAAQDGNVLVWEPSLNLLSNAFPIDINFVPPGPPTITGFNPPSVQAFAPGVVTMTGTGFSFATQVTVGGTVLSGTGFTIVSDTSITFTAPAPTALGPAGVTVTSLYGTSTPSTALSYVETNPPKITNAAVTFTNAQYVWNYGGGANDNIFLVASADASTFMAGGYTWILNYVPITMTTVNAVGLGSTVFQIPPGYSGVTFYSQIASIDEITGAVSGSNISTAHILF